MDIPNCVPIAAITPFRPAAAIDLRAELRHARRRPIRVLSLTAAIIAMSLADLLITMLYLETVGMGEGNPIARFVIGQGSPRLLVAWKSASVALACLVFIRYRDRRSTEAACWFAVGVLVWLLLRWTAYAEEAWRLTPALHILQDIESAMWVKMGE